MGVNANAKCHLVECDGTRIVVPVVGKRIKSFRKWQKAEPDPGVDTEDAGEQEEPEEGRLGNDSMQRKR